MQSAQAGFAKHPNDGVWWPRVRSALGRESGLSGSDGSSGVDAVDTLQSDYFCALYGPIADALRSKYKRVCVLQSCPSRSETVLLVTHICVHYLWEVLNDVMKDTVIVELTFLFHPRPKLHDRSLIQHRTPLGP